MKKKKFVFPELEILTLMEDDIIMSSLDPNEHDPNELEEEPL